MTQDGKKIKTIFMGTPDFSLPALAELEKNDKIELLFAVTMPDRPVGRGHKIHSPPVAEYCKSRGIKLFQTENVNRDPEVLGSIDNSEVDMILVLAFAQFLGSKILKAPKLGCFNIHTSILPKYRGAAPIQYAILNGDTVTGVSIQKMVRKMDAGDLALCQEVKIGETETGGELYDKLKQKAGSALSDFVDLLYQGKVTYTPQDESQVSIAPTLDKEDGHLDFDSFYDTEIFNRVRALYPWPGTYFFLDGKRLKVLEAKISSEKLKPSEIKQGAKNLIIGCKQGSLRLSKVQLEGKKACEDGELINGYKGRLIITPGAVKNG